MPQLQTWQWTRNIQLHAVNLYQKLIKYLHTILKKFLKSETLHTFLASTHFTHIIFWASAYIHTGQSYTDGKKKIIAHELSFYLIITTRPYKLNILFNSLKNLMGIFTLNTENKYNNWRKTSVLITHILPIKERLLIRHANSSMSVL